MRRLGRMRTLPALHGLRAHGSLSSGGRHGSLNGVVRQVARDSAGRELPSLRIQSADDPRREVRSVYRMSRFPAMSFHVEVAAGVANGGVSERPFARQI